MLANLRSLPYPVIAIGYVAGYVALDWVSYVQPLSPAGITPWGPASGLSIAVVLLLGLRYIPCIAASVIVADGVVRGFPLPIGLEIAAAAAVAAWHGGICAVLGRRFLRFDPRLETKRDLFLLLAAAFVGSVMLALCYAGLVVYGKLLASTDFWAAMTRYWVGDLIGITIMTPFLLVHLTRPRLSRPKAEMIVPLVLLGAALWLVFGYSDASRFQLFYLLFVPVVWTAARFGLVEVTWILVVTQIGLIFLIQFSDRGGDNLTAYQALMVVLSSTGLVTGSLVFEHQRVETQLRMLQDALARRARLSSTGEFAAALAHEINQPLTAIGNYVNLVKDAIAVEPPDRARATEAAGKAVDQVKRAAEVVRRLRDFIRLGHSGIKATRVAQLVEEAAALCRPDCDRHHVLLTLQIDRTVPDVLCDALQVQQVIVNLLRNSVEAIADARRHDGRITLQAARQEGDRVLFRVRDNGPGFDESLLGRQIVPFKTTKAQGLGLGLSLSRSIVETHGGRLALGGDAAGAEVAFTLPASRNTREAA